jgi:hypothetical protein
MASQADSVIGSPSQPVAQPITTYRYTPIALLASTPVGTAVGVVGTVEWDPATANPFVYNERNTPIHLLGRIGSPPVCAFVLVIGSLISKDEIQVAYLFDLGDADRPGWLTFVANAYRFDPVQYDFK